MSARCGMRAFVPSCLLSKKRPPTIRGLKRGKGVKKGGCEDPLERVEEDMGRERRFCLVFCSVELDRTGSRSEVFV